MHDGRHADRLGETVTVEDCHKRVGEELLRGIRELGSTVENVAEAATRLSLYLIEDDGISNGGNAGNAVVCRGELGLVRGLEDRLGDDASGGELGGDAFAATRGEKGKGGSVDCLHMNETIFSYMSSHYDMTGKEGADRQPIPPKDSP